MVKPDYNAGYVSPWLADMYFPSFFVIDTPRDAYIVTFEAQG